MDQHHVNIHHVGYGGTRHLQAETSQYGAQPVLHGHVFLPKAVIAAAIDDRGVFDKMATLCMSGLIASASNCGICNGKGFEEFAIGDMFDADGDRTRFMVDVSPAMNLVVTMKIPDSTVRSLCKATEMPEYIMTLAASIIAGGMASGIVYERDLPDDMDDDAKNQIMRLAKRFGYDGETADA